MVKRFACRRCGAVVCLARMVKDQQNRACYLYPKETSGFKQHHPLHYGDWRRRFCRSSYKLRGILLTLNCRTSFVRDKLSMSERDGSGGARECDFKADDGEPLLQKARTKSFG